MKKFLSICTITAICFGLCSTVIASLTVSQPGSNATGSPVLKIKDNSKDDDSGLGDWFQSLIDRLFGRNSKDRYWVYPSGNNGLSGGPGDGGWNGGSDDNGWDDGVGDGGYGGWDSSYGDGGHGGGFSNGDFGGDNSNACPVKPIPAPGAFLLGCIGSGVVTFLRRRRTL